MSDSKHKQAVILLNMGGPNNLFEVEIFLKNMFADPLILQIKNSFVRKMVGSMIVNSRLQKAKSNYSKIGEKSPLTELTFNLTQKLNKLDSTRFYTYAMRYTPPYSELVLKDLMQQGFSTITLFSMYPQYSQTTTLSSLRDFAKAKDSIKCDAKIKVVERYFDDENFIESCVDRILCGIHSANSAESTNEKKTDSLKCDDFVLFLSAHSIPQSVVDNGDPYKSEIEASVELIKAALKKRGANFKDIILTYQSKLGPIKWLEPDTKEMMKNFSGENLAVFPIAFSIDNSETAYELDIENRLLAKEIGIKNYIVCPCHNDSDAFAKMIINLVDTKTKDFNEIKI